MRASLSILAASVILAGSALAQTTTMPPAGSPPAGTRPASPGTGGPTGSSNPAVSTGGNAPSSVNASGTAALVAMTALEKGANSFTEGQVKSRLEGAGFSNVTDLAKDGDGIWRGKAMRDGKSVSVGFDYKGNIAAG
ncbi:hypothetical protein [uncultured Enterovirga sp.]|uniref:hypothetical protein n=1 Tax=uncultured Enterovirga sp. TaxID=2026352 RepID=UPI0035CC0C18